MNDDQRSEERTDAVLNETETLIWALLDENISPEDTRRLEELIRTDEDVRRRYLQCVELHTDLNALFAPPENPTPKTSTPVLGSLGDVFPTESRPPVVE